MSRRRSSRQDSLELLLDTICNTFGGVLFIAILVVLLLQQTGTGPAMEIATPAIPVSPVELQQLTLRMDEVADELARLRQNRDSQDAVVQTFAPDAIRQLMATRRALNGRQDELQAEVDRLLATNTKLVSEVETLGIENDAVRSRLEESQMQLKAAEARLQQERQSRVEEIRMPVVRSTFGKQEIGVVLRYGRLYVWHRYGPGQVRLGLNTNDFVVVEDLKDGLITSPKPTAGIALNTSAESQAAVKRVLQQFDPRLSYLVVIARPDSYDVFRHLRDRALETGFEYRLMPVDATTEITDRGGRGGNVQ
jgi:hypothetical protein